LTTLPEGHSPYVQDRAWQKVPDAYRAPADDEAASSGEERGHLGRRHKVDAGLQTTMANRGSPVKATEFSKACWFWFPLGGETTRSHTAYTRSESLGSRGDGVLVVEGVLALIQVEGNRILPGRSVVFRPGDDHVVGVRVEAAGVGVGDQAHQIRGPIGRDGHPRVGGPLVVPAVGRRSAAFEPPRVIDLIRSDRPAASTTPTRGTHPGREGSSRASATRHLPRGYQANTARITGDTRPGKEGGPPGRAARKHPASARTLAGTLRPGPATGAAISAPLAAARRRSATASVRTHGHRC
jgi:hypothetical protein